MSVASRCAIIGDRLRRCRPRSSGSSRRAGRTAALPPPASSPPPRVRPRGSASRRLISTSRSSRFRFSGELIVTSTYGFPIVVLPISSYLTRSVCLREVLEVFEDLRIARQLAVGADPEAEELVRGLRLSRLRLVLRLRWLGLSAPRWTSTSAASEVRRRGPLEANGARNLPTLNLLNPEPGNP